MFFSGIRKILTKAQSLDEREAFVFAVDVKVKDQVIKLNTVDQLGRFGVDSENSSLGDYADFTIEQRSALGLQTDHVDFKVTGNYWASWNITVNGEAMTINVDRNRFDELINDLKFSEDHVGLTPENLSKITEMLLINYRSYVRKKLFT